MKHFTNLFGIILLSVLFLLTASVSSSQERLDTLTVLANIPDTTELLYSHTFKTVFNGTGEMVDEGLRGLKLTDCGEGAFEMKVYSGLLIVTIIQDSLSVDFSFDIVSRHPNGKFLLLVDRRSGESILMGETSEPVKSLILQDTKKNITIFSDISTCN